MKIFKIIVGFLLIFSAGKEYANASSQLGSFYSPGVLLAISAMLIFSTWLIGSGMNTRKLKFKSLEFVKFLSINIVIFVSVSFYSLVSMAAPDNYKSINGINIPLNKCINGSKGIIPNKIERETYCACMAEKISNDSELKVKFKSQLERGRLMQIITELEKDGDLMKLELENCLNRVGMKWTDNTANSLRLNCIKDLQEIDFEQTNNIEDYCDCLVTEYRKQPFSKVMTEEFYESDIYDEIENKCTAKSKR